MANAKEIQNRIDSIRDTMKITRAMYMMSSMKLRKAKQKLENTEPYFTSLQEQIKDILYHYPDMQHLYFDNRNKDMKETVKKKGFIIVTGEMSSRRHSSSRALHLLIPLGVMSMTFGSLNT